MADALQAFLEFLVDFFAALSTFLGGKLNLDFGNIVDNLLNGGEDEGADEGDTPIE